MPILHNSLVPATGKEDPVTRSLRFDTNGKLSRTFGTPNSKKTFTLAFWVKRAGFSSTAFNEIWQYDRGGRGGGMGFAPTQSNWLDEEEFQLSSRNETTGVANVNITLTGRFRDPAAWTHIALVVDTTLGSSEAADRIKVFVNNERRTDYDTSHTHSYYWPAQNYEFSELFGGTGAPQNIGLRSFNNSPLNGYLADIYFIDGAAIEPDTNFIESTGFGSYKPKAFDMSSYSGNSFHIDAQVANGSDLLVSSIDRNDGDTLFADAAAGHTITATGDPEHSIAVGNPFTGDDRAIKFDGVDDNLVVTSDSSFNEFGTGDFTIEMWVNPTDQGSGSFAQMFELYGSTSDRMYLRIERQSSQNVYKFVNNGSNSFDVESDSAPDYGSWQHLAVVRNGTSITMYIDGTAQADSVTISSSATYNWPSTNLNIGKGNSSLGSGSEYGGYIFDYRITKGTAQYTSNFTPPTSKLSDNSSSLLLQPTKTDTSIGDSSSNSHTVTTVSSPTITASTPYDATAKSTAIYLDGTGDYLSVATSSDFDFGSGSYTYEGWFYFNGFSETPDGIFSRNNSSTQEWAVCTNSSGTLQFFESVNNSYNTSSFTFNTGQWYHIALCKNGTTYKVYVDGSEKISATLSSAPDANLPVIIGRFYDNYDGYYLDGYCFDFRAQKGVDTGGSKPSAPFELNPVYIGGDQSGNKNHFTPTNLNSTDIREDNPFKNHATWNPLIKRSSTSNIFTYSEGNTVATYTGGVAHTSTTIASSGVHYAEFAFSGGTSSISGAGVVRARWNGGNADSYTTNYGGCYYGSSGNVDSPSGSTSVSAVGSNRLGIAFDGANNKADFYSVTSSGTMTLLKSLTSSDSIDFDGSATFTATSHDTGATSITGYFEAGEWWGSAPSIGGTTATSLNTSNLDDPTVTPSENFNIALYNGNSSSNSITGLGFQPDVLWTKSRSTSGSSPKIFDSIRGVTKRLQPDQTAVEQTVSELTSFDSDGFTLGSDSGSNYSGRTYVAWNWKAHQSDARTSYTVRVEDASGDAWDSSGSFYDYSTYLPSVYMEILESRNGTLVSLGKVAVRSLDPNGNSMSNLSQQDYTLKCMNLNAIAVRWYYDTSGDGQEYDFPCSYNDLLNEQKITIQGGNWTTNNHSNDDGCTDYDYSAPTGWANGDSLKTATTSYNGTDIATLHASWESAPTEKYNSEAGFTIISYSGDSGSDGDTQNINHSLGVPLEFVLVKNRTNTNSNTSGDWIVWHKDLPSNKFLKLNSNNTTRTTSYGDIITTAVSGSQHQVVVANDYDNNSGTAHWLNDSGYYGSPEEYILYGWATTPGMCKVGSYEGNGSSDGPFLAMDFAPAFFLYTNIDSSEHWYITDNKRPSYNVSSRNAMFAGTASAESTESRYQMDFLSNGVKIRATHAKTNANNQTYLYLAMAESPFRYGNGK